MNGGRFTPRQHKWLKRGLMAAGAVTGLGGLGLMTGRGRALLASAKFARKPAAWALGKTRGAYRYGVGARRGAWAGIKGLFKKGRAAVGKGRAGIGSIRSSLHAGIMSRRHNPRMFPRL